MSQQQDDDGTVIDPRTAASAFPPTASSSHTAGRTSPLDDADDVLSLRVGSRIAEFEIIRRLGTGGFSIVYLARDHSLERTVALKEYLPSSLAMRVGATQVQPRTQHRETFELGLKSFINEAKLLASFDHPSLVKVYRFWEANGTAYMVMPFYQGKTLKETIRAMPEPPDEAWLRNLLAPLTEALMVIHADHCYHRDIAPDNVVLLAGSGRPLLLDFGAARRVIGDMTHSLTVILKAGYAPVEQYAEVPGMKQGPWTDVYALAALVHWIIVGSTPPASVGRMLGDSLEPLATRAAGRYTTQFLQAIDRALMVLPDRRTQTIEALRHDLGIHTGDDVSPETPAPLDDSDGVTVVAPIGPRSEARATARSALPGMQTRPSAPPPPAPPVARSEVRDSQRVTVGTAARQTHVPTRAPAVDRGPQQAGLRPTVIAVTVVGAVAIAAGIWWIAQRPSASPRAASQEQGATVPAPPPPSAQPSADANRAAETQPATQPMPPPSEGTQAEAPPGPMDTQPAKPSPTPPVVPAEAMPEKAPARAAKKVVPQDSGNAQPERAKPAGSDDRAECARIFQRLSLGENNPELLERLKALKCR